MIRSLIIFFFCWGVMLTPQQTFSKDIQPTALPKSVMNLYKTDENCFDLGKDKLPQAIEADQVSTDTVMFIIPCSVGAYNIFSKIYLLSNGEVEQLFFADHNAEQGWFGSEILVNPGYDSGTKTLNSFRKSVGHGGCGSSGIWRWRDYNFQMTHFQSYSNCDQAKAPEEWPYVYTHK